jgi:hypothetical protein
MLDVVNGYLMRVFDVERAEDIPKVRMCVSPRGRCTMIDVFFPPRYEQFISIHARHGDFENLCADKDKKWDCFAPLSAFDQRVKEIQHELQHRPGERVQGRERRVPAAARHHDERRARS